MNRLYTIYVSYVCMLFHIHSYVMYMIFNLSVKVFSLALYVFLYSIYKLKLAITKRCVLIWIAEHIMSTSNDITT